MQPIVAIPGPIAFPSGTGLNQAVIFVTVDLLSLIAANERFYVRFVFRALYPRIFQPDIQNPGGLAEAMSGELRSPVYPESQFMTIRHPSAKTAKYGFLQGLGCLPGTAAVRENVSDDITVTGIYHHAQIGIGAAGPHIGEVSFPISIADYRPDNDRPAPFATF